MNQLLIFNPNNFMEKRKPRESIADELALAKSAAWAWLEHRSGSDDRTKPEFDVSRTKFNPKPSRYKVEAMRKTSTRKIDASPTVSRQYSLLDRYEIERISRQLDFIYIRSNHANLRGGHRGGRKAEAVAAAEIKSKSAAQKKKMSKGYFSLLGSHHAVVCGSSIDEVVDRASNEYLRRRPRRQRSGHVAVAEFGCRPRQGIRA